jgi:hypothetical protein
MWTRAIRQRIAGSFINCPAVLAKFIVACILTDAVVLSGRMQTITSCVGAVLVRNEIGRTRRHDKVEHVPLPEVRADHPAEPRSLGRSVRPISLN